MAADDDAAEFNCPENHRQFPETQKWAFKSTAWEEASFIHVNLEEIHGKKDEYFIRMLQKCRLACSDHRLAARVTLRGGMLVILQVNLDLQGGLVNGSQGIICGFEVFDPEKLPKAADKGTKFLPPHQRISGDHAKLRERQIKGFMEQQRGGSQLAQAWPRVLFHNGRKRVIYVSCIVNSVVDEEPYSLLHRTQIPLVAGWAMTVHRSQGMTPDRVIVDLSNAFEEGQVYVALSRATSLSGLKIVGSPSGLFTTGGNHDVQIFLQEKFGDGLSKSIREFSGHIAQDTNGVKGESKARNIVHRAYY
ncbi:atp-dependent dna helicase pif1 [Trichoderma arundinaceum]|uniref:Atp-dependent dna helicase pif1 n=1 Tax=Trichoderma arundinaceum TaxID=490622 RepID=A0A395NR75_TRIAR|nr:atp-dependent dna helicase pif1 [Trichoderma arundinaceum]